MSVEILQAVSKLLEAKSHEPNPALRGALVKDLAVALNIPHTSINSALRNEIEAAKFGIFRLSSPTRKRYVLWGFNRDVMEKANSGPFDATTGINREVQAAEVNKLVTACPEPIAHEKYKTVLGNMDQFRQMLGLSVEDWPDSLMFGRIFDVAAAHWNEHFKTNKIGDNDDSE